jgi:hypothetical protein
MLLQAFRTELRAQCRADLADVSGGDLTQKHFALEQVAADILQIDVDVGELVVISAFILKRYLFQDSIDQPARDGHVGTYTTGMAEEITTAMPERQPRRPPAHLHKRTSFAHMHADHLLSLELRAWMANVQRDDCHNVLDCRMCVAPVEVLELPTTKHIHASHLDF